MKKTIGNEIKTGIMIVACAAVLMFILYRIGAFRIGETGYEIYTEFGYASGIEMNAPVRLAGVEVGEVSDIMIRYGENPKVVLTLTLDKSAEVKDDSTADINTMGLMGEKYVELSLGSPQGKKVKPGSTIVGEDPFQMDKLLKKSEVIAENLDQAITDIRALANNLNGVVVDNRQGIDNIIANLESTSKNFEEFSEDIKKHPWKLLVKGKEKDDDEEKDRRKKQDRGFAR
jgi:phospholipid/cholesterol/gamma-HCH transport system substrate-binding protein